VSGNGPMRFALPPSLGKEPSARAERLAHFLSTALDHAWTVVSAESYDALAKDILSGRIDAAWAPPFEQGDLDTRKAVVRLSLPLICMTEDFGSLACTAVIAAAMG